MKKRALVILHLSLLAFSAFCIISCKNSSAKNGQIRIAYITNGVASFWSIAQAGAEAAGRDLGVKVSVHMPTDINDQKRIVEDVLTRGVDGIAISLIDATNQTSLVNETAAKTTVITQDADAPLSNRLAYVGMDNYLAGRMLGSLVKEALPEGGELALFVGRIEQDNARRRRQGVIDEVLGRSIEPSRYDPPGKPLTDGKYTFVTTLTDQFDRVKAKANCEDALLQYPQLAGMIGLFVYNPPACLEALKQANKVGAIKIFSFDEADESLQAIEQGTMVGTIVQNPYEYGYQSIKLLKDILLGNIAAIPPSKFIDIPARRIDHTNVSQFAAELRQKLGKQ